MKQNSFLKTLKGKKTKPTPVWFMRQAGRYLKEYRELKKKYSFLEMCKTPELAAKITLMPLKLGVDALIIFSDILIPLLSVGAEIEYTEGVQPKLDLQRNFEYKGLDNIEFLKDAIKIVKDEQSDIPLLGFAASPFTLLCYLFGGAEFSNIRVFMFSNPEEFKTLMEKTTRLTIDYLNFQLNSGCDAVQLFDSWAGILPANLYKTLVFPYVKEIASNIKAPLIYFVKNSCHINDFLKEIEANCFSIDSRSSLKKIYSSTNKCVQGNLDNAVLLTDRETIKNETLKVLKETEEIPHIFNLSHGILPNTDPDKVKFLTDLVHNETSK
ncbi:uroporphyrinogen decarboxylase [Hippea alviniae]|uniref:uroporphyrinogen decarboxylase n=1 Tax=Hippea alviniae TaxID=1279027 RepID=UPI0003B5FF2F|nr:uroporphyrinogen decarboxylase [Hippea alviniae]